MSTGQKMGTSFPKGIKKFVNGYRARNGNVFPKRYWKIRQWVEGEKMGTSFQKGIKKFVNGYRARNGNVFPKRY